LITAPALVIGSYLAGALLLFGALAVVLMRDMLRAALALLFTFFMVAVVYALLSAEFLFAVQLFVYTVAVAGLVAFAIMLTRDQRGGRASPFNRQVAAAAVVSLGIFFLLAGALWTTAWPLTTWPNIARTDETLGRAFLTRYAVPFEAMAVLLLTAVAGAIVLVVREELEVPAAILPLPERRRRRRRRRGIPQVTAEAQK